MTNQALMDLVGDHVLSGINRGVTSNGYEDHTDVILVLDGQAYRFEEDGDGYRSYLSNVFQVDNPREISPIDPPVQVTARHETQGDEDLLILTSKRTGKDVLEIGTSDATDWYPTFVFSWRPEDL